MRAFVTIGPIDDSGGVPFIPIVGRFWDGSSTMFAFSRTLALSITDVEDDFRKAIIDDVVSYLSGYGLARSDVVFVG